MKKISKMTYDNFIIDGEVNEQLPLNSNNLKNLYFLNNNPYTLYPNFELKANQLIHGNNSMIISKSNINLLDGYMNFNANSKLVLDSSIVNFNDFNFEIKFKLTDIINDSTLLLCKSDNVTKFSLMIDSSCRYIYAQINGKTISVADISEQVFSITDSGAINTEIWYSLKVIKNNNIAVIYINDIYIKSFLFREDISFNALSIGSFVGHVDYIRLSKGLTQDFKNRYSIVDNSLLNNFTVAFYWTPKIISSYNIATLGQLSINSNANTIDIDLNNSNILKASIFEDNTYYIALSYDIDTQKIYVYIYNQTSHKLILKDEVSISSLNNAIDIINSDYVYDLAIYNTCLDEKSILRNVSKKFSMSKYGNIEYNINEDDIGFKMRDYYHLPLTQDMNSLCETILVNDEDNIIMEEGTKSGSYEATYVTKLIEKDTLEIANEKWDKNLHHKAYKVENWTSGYNESVTNSNIGYHAKWIKENESQDSLALKFINCNSDFDMTNRMLHSYRILTPEEIWNKCKVGDNIKIIFEAKADMPCDIKMGIYKYLSSSSTNSFGGNLKTISIKDSSWNEYCYETVIEEDWDLSKDAKLYIYGYLTDKSTSYIKNIYLIINGDKAPIKVIKDKDNRVINIPFINQIKLAQPSVSILYNSKLISNNNKITNSIGNIKWGVENNKLFVRHSNKESLIAIDNIEKDEWISIGLIITNSKIVMYLGTRKGICECILNNVSLTMNDLSNIIFDSNNCSLYKDLIITKNTITKEDFERHHRTKMSYHNNSLYLKSEIEESNL